jgi:hypothetical protein
MSSNPFLDMAGEQPSLKKKVASKKEMHPIAKNAVWEDLGEEFSGNWSGQPSYWKMRKKYLKGVAIKHHMWLNKQNGIYYLVWKGRKGADILATRDLWEIKKKMREKAKLRWLM